MTTLVLISRDDPPVAFVYRLRLRDAGIIHLTALTGLSTLKLIGFRGLRDAELAPLAALPHLQQLVVTGDRLTLACVAPISQLQRLHFHSPAVHNVHPLLALTKLVHLNLRGACFSGMRALQSWEDSS